MYGIKIQSLNDSVEYALEAMRTQSKLYPNVEVLVKVVAFDSSVTPSGFDLLDVFKFSHLRSGADTNMGGALGYVADDLNTVLREACCLPPVIVLVTDGYPTDAWRNGITNFDDGLGMLLASQHGPKAIRIGVAIGEEVNMDVLKRFIGNEGIPVLQANNAEDLTKFMQWIAKAIGGGVMGLLSSGIPEASTDKKDW
jgi:uncharacterized protein YegL